MFKPLKDITVLDLTQVLAGPFGSYQLSFLGAKIIKIENPDEGDWARKGGMIKNYLIILWVQAF